MYPGAKRDMCCPRHDGEDDSGEKQDAVARYHWCGRTSHSRESGSSAFTKSPSEVHAPWTAQAKAVFSA